MTALERLNGGTFRPIRELSVRDFIKLLLLATLIAVVFGELYNYSSTRSQMPSWVIIGLLNSALAVGLIVSSPRVLPSLRRQVTHWIAWVPSILILFGSIALVVFWPGSGTRRNFSAYYLLGSSTWIPVVEEVVFRGGISPLFRRVTNSLWGVYFSSLVFALAHSAPTLTRMIRFEVGIPLGPFLLGLCCEALLIWTKSLWPAIAFHCACNATVIIFDIFGPGWFDRLSWFYS